MNIKQANKINMFEKTAAFLEQYSSLYSSLTGLTTAITNIKDLIAAMWQKDREKGSAVTGKTDAKSTSYNALVKQTLLVSAGLFLYSRKNKSAELKALSNIKKSSLTHLRDAELANKATSIFNSAKDKDLTEFNVTTAQITALNEAVKTFQADIAAVSTGISNKVGAGKTLDNLIDEADDLLKEEIDKYMLTLKEGNTEFFNGYAAARVIWDKGGKHKIEEPVKTEEQVAAK